MLANEEDRHSCLSRATYSSPVPMAETHEYRLRACVPDPFVRVVPFAGVAVQSDTPTNGRAAHNADPAADPAAGDGRVSTEFPPRTGRRLAIAAGVLALVLAVTFGVAFAVRHGHEAAAGRSAAGAADAPDAVDVVAVRPTKARYAFTLPGQTAGWYQSTLYGRVDGYIGSWSADIGDRVKRGQVLATIETPELDQQLAAAQAKAAASDAQVDVAQSNESIARLTFDRWRDSPKGVVSDQEREEKQAMYVAAKAHLTEARAQARLDAADAGRYAALEVFRQVTAPYDGVVTARDVDLRDLVTAGSSGNTRPLYRIAQYDTIRVFVDVPQKAVADLTPGLPAQVATDASTPRSFDGRVARSAMSIDVQTRTERVEVDVANPGLTLVPGMYVQVTFDVAQRGLLQVPAASILYRPTGLQVAVIDAAGHVGFRPVTVAQDDGDTVELAGGVAVGERVALNLSSAVTSGQQVRAVDVGDPDRGPAPATEPANTAPLDKPAGGTNGAD